MNYIKDIVEKVLPVAIGEEFNIILDDGRYCMYNPFKFTETDLVDTFGGVFTAYIGRIITQEYKIEKIPFAPKIGESYWTYYNDDDCFPRGRAVGKIWNDSTFDKERNLLGVVFRTEQDAKNYLPIWMEHS